LASASEYEDLFREKERYARYYIALANNSDYRHRFVSENPSAFLASNKLFPILLNEATEQEFIH
jgi:hypothetical protein